MAELIISSMIFPRESNESLPQAGEWPLKSPSKIKGLVSYSIREVDCCLFTGFDGVKYKQQTVIVLLAKDSLAAMASKRVSSCTDVNIMSFLKY